MQIRQIATIGNSFLVKVHVAKAMPTSLFSVQNQYFLSRLSAGGSCIS